MKLQAPLSLHLRHLGILWMNSKGTMQIQGFFFSLAFIQKVWRGTHFFMLRNWKRLPKGTSEATSRVLLRIRWGTPLLWSSWKESREVKLLMDDYLPLKAHFDLLIATNSFPIDMGFLASCRSFLKLDGKGLICQMSRKAHYSEDYWEGQGYLGTYCRQVGQVEAWE